MTIEEAMERANAALQYAIESPCWACNAHCGGKDQCADDPHILACPRDVYRHALKSARAALSLPKEEKTK